MLTSGSQNALILNRHRLKDYGRMTEIEEDEIASLFVSVMNQCCVQWVRSLWATRTCSCKCYLDSESYITVCHFCFLRLGFGQSRYIENVTLSENVVQCAMDVEKSIVKQSVNAHRPLNWYMYVFIIHGLETYTKLFQLQIQLLFLKYDPHLVQWQAAQTLQW